MYRWNTLSIKDDEPLDRTVLKADWLLFLTAIIWGGAFVAQRVGMDYVGPFTFNGIRFSLGALVLVPLVVRQNPLAPPEIIKTDRKSRRILIWGSIGAGFILFGGAAFQQIGLVYTTAGKAGFITGLYVIIVPVLGLFIGFRPKWGGWVGACMAAFGLYLLSVREDLTFAPGDLLVLISAFFWALHVLIISWLSPRVRRIRLACLQFAVCAILSLSTAVLFESIILDSILQAAIPILYGGCLSVGIAYTLQVVAQRYAPPVHAAVILSLEAVFAAVAGWVILGEVLCLKGMVGCGLMLAGMLTAQLKS